MQLYSTEKWKILSQHFEAYKLEQDKKKEGECMPHTLQLCYIQEAYYRGCLRMKGEHNIRKHITDGMQSKLQMFKYTVRSRSRQKSTKLSLIQ